MSRALQTGVRLCRGTWNEPNVTDANDDLEPLGHEIERILESATYSAQGQFEQAKFWRALNLLLGVPAASLAAIAGGTGLAGVAGRVPAAIMALTAAGLGAVLTTLNAANRTTLAQASANEYLALQSAARQLRTIDLARLSWEEARDRLAALSDRYDQINASAAPPNFYSYWRAKRNLTMGRQTFQVDQPAS
jgi:hypothetical protein